VGKKKRNKREERGQSRVKIKVHTRKVVIRTESTLEIEIKKPQVVSKNPRGGRKDHQTPIIKEPKTKQEHQLYKELQRPTCYMPGTEEKITLLSLRRLYGLPLYVDGDIKWGDEGTEAIAFTETANENLFRD
jgi:hypothetical protein